MKSMYYFHYISYYLLSFFLIKSKLNAQKQGAWDRFMGSVRSRLNVAQIVRDVRQDAAITFDFLVLVIAAA